MAECHVCELNAKLDSLPASERAYLDDSWRLAHAWSALPGWLVLLPRRHIEALAELVDAEADALGPILRSASAALRSVVGCEKTYVMLFAEATGFGHVHFHIVPRAADLAPEHVGPRVFSFLGRPESEWVSQAERDRLAAAIGVRMAAELGSPGTRC